MLYREHLLTVVSEENKKTFRISEYDKIARRLNKNYELPIIPRYFFRHIGIMERTNKDGSITGVSFFQKEITSATNEVHGLFPPGQHSVTFKFPGGLQPDVVREKSVQMMSLYKKERLFNSTPVIRENRKKYIDPMKMDFLAAANSEKISHDEIDKKEVGDKNLVGMEGVDYARFEIAVQALKETGIIPTVIGRCFNESCFKVDNLITPCSGCDLKSCPSCLINYKNRRFRAYMDDPMSLEMGKFLLSCPGCNLPLQHHSMYGKYIQSHVAGTHLGQLRLNARKWAKLSITDKEDSSVLAVGVIWTMNSLDLFEEQSGAYKSRKLEFPNFPPDAFSGIDIPGYSSAGEIYHIDMHDNIKLMRPKKKHMTMGDLDSIYVAKEYILNNLRGRYSEYEFYLGNRFAKVPTTKLMKRLGDGYYGLAMKVELLIVEDPLKCRVFFIPHSRKFFIDRLFYILPMMHRKGKFPYGPGFRWQNGGAAKIANYLKALSGEGRIYEEYDFSKYDLSHSPVIMAFSLLMDLVYYDVEGPMFTTVASFLKWSSEQSISKSVHVYDNIILTFMGILCSGEYKTADGNTLIHMILRGAYLYKCYLSLIGKGCAIRKMRPEDAGRLVSEVKEIFYGDDHICSMLPEFAQLFPSENFQKYAGKFWGYEIKYIRRSHVFFSEVDEKGELSVDQTKVGPKFLSRYFINDPNSGILAFRPFSEHFARVVNYPTSLFNNSSVTAVFIQPMRIIGHLWDSQGSNPTFFKFGQYYLDLWLHTHGSSLEEFKTFLLSIEYDKLKEMYGELPDMEIAIQELKDKGMRLVRDPRILLEYPDFDYVRSHFIALNQETAYPEDSYNYAATFDNIVNPREGRDKVEFGF